jgi:hypothetical protein
MVSQVQSSSNMWIQEMEMKVEEIDQVVDSLKKQDMVQKKKEITELLNEYILANSTPGKASGAADIKEQMQEVMSSFSHEIQTLDELKDKVKDLLNHPSAEGEKQLEEILNSLLERARQS